MAHPRNSIPSYLPHTSGRARAVWTDSTGTRRFRLLPGPFESPESRTAFARLLLELDVAPHHHARPVDQGGLTVNEILLAYLRRGGGVGVAEVGGFFDGLVGG